MVVPFDRVYHLVFLVDGPLAVLEAPLLLLDLNKFVLQKPTVYDTWEVNSPTVASTVSHLDDFIILASLPVEVSFRDSPENIQDPPSDSQTSDCYHRTTNITNNECNPTHAASNCTGIRDCSIFQ